MLNFWMNCVSYDQNIYSWKEFRTKSWKKNLQFLKLKKKIKVFTFLQSFQLVEDDIDDMIDVQTNV